MIELLRGEARAERDGRPRRRGPVVGRRTCLIAGAGVIASASPCSFVNAAPSRGDIRYVLTDLRIGASIAFGRALSARGAERRDVSAGLTSIWRNDLSPLWRAGSGGVAGLTSAGVWECVAEQARSHSRRTILIGFHSVDRRSETASHRLVLPPPLVDIAGANEMDNATWPLAMAAIAGRSFITERDGAADRRTGPARPAVAPFDSLVSWVIA